MKETRDILQVMVKLQELLPENAVSFLIKECFKAKIRNIVLQSGTLGLAVKGCTAAIDLETREIFVDLDKDLNRYRETIYQRHGLRLEDEKEALLFLFLHEVSHASVGTDEERADERAKALFFEWVEIRGALKREIEAQADAR